ncbi:MAG: ABC transporter permease [Pseudomonadota bacterium]
MTQRIQTQDRSLFMQAMMFLELLYFSIVRSVRKESGNRGLGILNAVLRTLAMVIVFYLVFTLIRIKPGGIRGDPILFLVGGVLFFLLHNAAVSRTIQAGAQSSPMMNHAPMTVVLNILSETVAQLYLFILTGLIILSGVFVIRGELDIEQPAGIVLPLLLAWASGVVMGLVFLVLKPFAPRLMQVISLFYQRANMITSGKFFVANMLPLSVLPYFAWNPLFHTIDQMRGAMFINYNPQYTSLMYPVYFVAIGLVIGMMFEFWLRKTVSRSTGSQH